jgi:branched-chain amino acid transport system substrate-binding protein
MSRKISTEVPSDGEPRFVFTRRGVLKAGLGLSTASLLMPIAAPRVWAKTYPSLGTYPAGVEGKSIFVGGVMPLTGPYAAAGEDQKRGFELAVEHLNNGSRITEAVPSLKKGGGVLGKKIDYEVGDSQTKPNPAVQTGSRFIHQNKAILLIGSVSSAVAVALEELGQRSKVIWLCGNSASNATTGKDCQRFGFRSQPPAYMIANALAPVLAKHLGKDLKVAYLVPNYTYGTTFYTSLVEFTGKQGWKSINEQLVPLGTTDFSSYLLNIANSGADVFINETFGADADTSTKQAEQFGILKKMKYVFPLFHQFAAKDLAPDVIGGLYGHQPWWWTEENTYPLAKYFVEDFHKKYGYMPRWGASEAYIQMIVWADAVERAGTFYPGEVIHALESGDKVDTIYGKVWYRAGDHQMVRPVPIMVGKTKSEMKEPEDYYDIIELVPGEQVVPPLAETGCHMPGIAAA